MRISQDTSQFDRTFNLSEPEEQDDDDNLGDFDFEMEESKEGKKGKFFGSTIVLPTAQNCSAGISPSN